ncbi:MAG TPA: hypothetical protein PKL83_00365, partial [bacterium]|nr:hypothetical protein [bacterium]
SVLALERITTEIYKAFLRQEAQEKYLIPSDLNLRIPLVLRRGIGLILLFCIWSMVLFWDPQIQPTVLVMVFGIVSALGGMAKDAPYEGIEPVKFFRTPVLTVVSALGIQALFSDLASKFFLLAIGGAERVLSESYKKYIRGRVPGKFKSPEIHNTDWQEKRKVVTPLYLMNLLAFIVLAVLR